MKYFSIVAWLLLIFHYGSGAEESPRPSDGFGSMFAQNEAENSDQKTAEDFFISSADTYNAEGDFEKSLSLLQKVENQDTAKWCDVAATAYLGDRNYKQAKEAFICAKEHYETEGNLSKVRQMQAHIDYLTPSQ